MSSRILECSDLVRRFGGVAALDGATLSVEEGSITALIGPNGAGKTTLFNVVSGFVGAQSGTVSFAGERIDGRPAHRVARTGLVRTFQLTRAFTRMSVLENVLLGTPDHPGEQLWGVGLRARASRARERDAIDRAHEILRLLELDRLADDYAGTLSGGQRKLLEFGRALMASPRMLLLDEPMAGINPVLGRKLLDHIATIRETFGVTILFIEHDMEVVMATAERVLVMNEGRLIAEGPPSAVRADPRVIEAYLGAPA